MRLKLLACVTGATLRCYGSSVFYNSVLSPLVSHCYFTLCGSQTVQFGPEADVCTVDAK